MKQSVLPLGSMFSLFNVTSPPANCVNTIVPGTGSAIQQSAACGSELFILTGNCDNRTFIYKSI